MLTVNFIVAISTVAIPSSGVENNSVSHAL